MLREHHAHSVIFRTSGSAKSQRGEVLTFAISSRCGSDVLHLTKRALLLGFATCEARGRQTLRQRVGHHMMRVQWNQFDYVAQAQLAEVIFPNIDVTRILATHRVDRYSNARKIVLVH